MWTAQPDIAVTDNPSLDSRSSAQQACAHWRSRSQRSRRYLRASDAVFSDPTKLACIGRFFASDSLTRLPEPAAKRLLKTPGKAH